MFSIHCTELGAEVLRPPSAIISSHRTSDGGVIYARCQCGALVMIATGRDQGWRQLRHAAPPVSPVREPVAAESAA